MKGKTMLKIRTFNKIDPNGLNRLPENFELTEGDDYDGIILRSYKMSEAEINESLLAVARAGAGVNNIPIELYAEKGVVVFNTPGANANAVKELVISGLLLASRNIIGGVNWLQGLNPEGIDIAKEVEANKSKFGGNEILGKKIGIIGLGAIGAKLAKALVDLGLEVYGIDPFLTVENALTLDSNIKLAKSIEDMFAICDFISIHVPQTNETKGFVNSELLKNAKDGIKIMNFARGGLCDDDSMIEAVKSGKVAKYVTDFPNEKLLGYENIITIPHLGASTAESETNCAIMAADEITQYLVNGNIINSVNYPNCNMGEKSASARIAINYKSCASADIASAIEENKLNATAMQCCAKGDFGYALIDTNEDTTKAVEQIKAIAGVLKIRVL